jgi:hypothetical protein
MSNPELITFRPWGLVDLSGGGAAAAAPAVVVGAASGAAGAFVGAVPVAAVSFAVAAASIALVAASAAIADASMVIADMSATITALLEITAASAAVAAASIAVAIPSVAASATLASLFPHKWSTSVTNERTMLNTPAVTPLSTFRPFRFLASRHVRFVSCWPRGPIRGGWPPALEGRRTDPSASPYRFKY